VSAKRKPAVAAILRKRLRYMSPEHIAEDFPDAQSRAAIAAVFKWLSLNATCAWRLKNGTYTNVAMSKTVHRELGTSDALILDEERYERARKLLAGEDGDQ